jgi:hypothetical protein
MDVTAATGTRIARTRTGTMRRLILILPLTMTVWACDIRQDQSRVTRDAPPAAAVLAPGQGIDLSEMLARVAQEIEQAMAGEPDRVLTAEAMTDQLLQVPRDVDWLATGYSVEARLRQIQAQADAIVALMRRGATLSAVDSDLRTLKASIRDLQRQLDLPGGGPAPPTLETLLAQDPLRDARARVGAAASPATPTETGPQPIGQPLGTPTTPPDG